MADSEEDNMKIEDILQQFEPISLSDMKDIRLMNRTDTKFVTSRAKLIELLLLAAPQYYVQEIDGKRIGDYHTVYFDTPNYDMFRVHNCGHANRQKLRIRSYVESKLSFLEVKTKNNRKRTKKKRISMPGFDPTDPRYDIVFDGHEKQFADCEDFLRNTLHYDATTLTERLENRFHRITLVNKGKTERLTIDLDLQFNNIFTGEKKKLDNVVIIELKRDGLKPSPILALLKQLRIKKCGFSKYCIGTAYTYPKLPQNGFKERIRAINKIQGQDPISANS